MVPYIQASKMTTLQEPHIGKNKLAMLLDTASFAEWYQTLFWTTLGEKGEERIEGEVKLRMQKLQ